MRNERARSTELLYRRILKICFSPRLLQITEYIYHETDSDTAEHVHTHDNAGARVKAQMVLVLQQLHFTYKPISSAAVYVREGAALCSLRLQSHNRRSHLDHQVTVGANTARPYAAYVRACARARDNNTT